VAQRTMSEPTPLRRELVARCGPASRSQGPSSLPLSSLASPITYVGEPVDGLARLT